MITRESRNSFNGVEARNEARGLKLEACGISKDNALHEKRASGFKFPASIPASSPLNKHRASLLAINTCIRGNSL